MAGSVPGTFTRCGGPRVRRIIARAEADPVGAEKAFFFGKRSEVVTRAVTHRARKNRDSARKSFLVLFFKKEHASLNGCDGAPHARPERSQY
jgi:hypothetical protein